MRRREIHIRKLRPSDARKVSDLIRNTLYEVNSKDYPPDIIQNLCDSYSPENIIVKSTNQSIFVACDENQMIIGTVSLQDDTIEGLFVDPNVHHQGVGTRLMNHVESITRTNGYHIVQLASSITAFEFYRQRGYQTIKHASSLRYGQVIIMEKTL